MAISLITACDRATFAIIGMHFTAMMRSFRVSRVLQLESTIDISIILLVHGARLAGGDQAKVFQARRVQVDVLGHSVEMLINCWVRAGAFSSHG